MNLRIAKMCLLLTWNAPNSKHRFATSFLQPLAVFSYAADPRKLSANEQFFVCWCSNSNKFVTNNSDKTRRVIYSRQRSLYQHKQKRLSSESRRKLFSFFLLGVDASRVYVRALALGCFYSHISTRTAFRRVLTTSLDSCAEIKNAPSVA